MWEDHGCDGKITSDGHLVATEYNRKEEASRGQQHLELNYWWGEGLMWMVAPKGGGGGGAVDDDDDDDDESCSITFY